MADNQEYENFLKLLKKRTSVRRFKPDPIPDGHIEKILEAARWAMSGANSQPWEFIVIKDPKIKAEIEKSYREHGLDLTFWMEQQRVPELRHPAFQSAGALEEQLKSSQEVSWSDAPVLIAVVGDGRKQWGTVMAGHTFGGGATNLSDGLANASTIIHLAAAALGLGSRWVTIHVPEPVKQILRVPPAFVIRSIIPIGYPAGERRPGYRRELSFMVHYETYDMSKYLPNSKVIDYLRELRQRTKPGYSASRGTDKP